MAEGYANPFRLPPPLNITEGNVSENYKKWKRQVEVYLEASGASDKPDKTKTAIILHCAGPQVLEVYDQITWAEAGDKDKPEKVFEQLQKFCNPRKNEVLETHRFWNVQYQDQFDNFLTELRTRAASCNFDANQDRMIRDKIVFTVTGKLQELLLREDDLDLVKAIKICRAYEQSNKQVKEIRDSTQAPQKVNKISNEAKSNKNKPKAQGQTQQKSKPKWQPPQRGKGKSCDFCGYKHERIKEKCPAWGKICDNCKGRNHFKVKCKKVHSVSLSGDKTEDNSDDDYWLASIESGPKEAITAVMQVNDCSVRFQVDSAADVNTLCQKYVRKCQVKPTTARLRMWNKSALKPLGEAVLNVRNPRTGESSDIKFTVVPNNYTCLLGLKTIQKLNLITINDDKFIAVVGSKELGDLGEATLKVDPEVTPKALPCRKLPIALQDDVKREIDHLVERNILVPVTEPTKWVSQMAVPRKPNGKIRICIDPQPLNTALMREHYKLPTLDDVLPKLNNAKIFSKLDVKEAYWHVKLDEESSKLTTMITPFGRYRWARLPFGLKVSSEIFQRKLNEVLGDLDGVFTIADDIIVVGCGNTEAEAKTDNERKLKFVYNRCNEQNIILNDDKKAVGLTEISFHGHKITASGLKVDEAKVKAINEMPAPTDISGVKRLCGVVQYMSKFLPDLAETMEPIRALTRNNVKWDWSQECEKSFQSVKEQLTTAPVLAYFDPEKELVLQVDSSKNGLGAVLLQNGKPIEFASRSLKPAERNWAQIEKEALSILYGLERFDQYTYGRKIRVQNDHRPLGAILSKPLSRAPKRLQDIMMKLYRYDFDFQYVKGTDLILADTLSRAYLDTYEGASEDRPRIMTVSMFENIPDARIEEVREATAKDATMQTLLRVILDGWPKSKANIPLSLTPYFDMRDELTCSDGIILKGEAILIPKELRNNMKKRLHSAHLGYDSMMRRARGVIFWPGMAKDIRQLADICETCQERKPRNQHETLLQHEDGDIPWNKIGLDLFEIQGRQYLVAIDYYSNFIEVDQLTTTTSTRVVTLLKKQFARFGIPTTIVSDGGPQFTARDFETFTKQWGITHVMSSPGHPSANGKAEAAVKIIKTMMIKTLEEGQDQNEALLELRNTPRQDTGLSPAQMMFGRQTRSMIPEANRRKNLKIEKRSSRKLAIKKSYDKKARDLPVLEKGQSVYFEHKKGELWKKGKVVERLSNRSYIVKTESGSVYRRNRYHMRPTKVNIQIREHSPMRITSCDGSPANILSPNLKDPISSIKDQSNDSIVSLPEIPNEQQPTQFEQTETLAKSTPELNARPKRTTREPAYLKDYVRY